MLSALSYVLLLYTCIVDLIHCYLPRVIKDRQDYLVLKGMLVHLEIQVPQDLWDPLVSLAERVVAETRDHQDPQDLRDSRCVLIYGGSTCTYGYTLWVGSYVGKA